MSLIEQIPKKATKPNEEISDFLSTQLENENFGDISAKEKKNLLSYHKSQRHMFINLLKNPLSTYPIKNAYCMDFGSWESGIFDTTHDDFMNSAESGFFCLYCNFTIWQPLVKGKNKNWSLMIHLLNSVRSSVRNNYPWWRI